MTNSRLTDRMISMKPEYHEGPEARKKFEQGMTRLFKAPKSKVAEPTKKKPKSKQGKASKG